MAGKKQRTAKAHEEKQTFSAAGQAGALTSAAHPPQIACFLPSLAGGGAEKAALNLLRGLAKLNLATDLVVGVAAGRYSSQVPKETRLVSLGAKKVIQAILPLAGYLRREQPSALLSYMSHANFAAVMARALARADTRLVLVEQTVVSARRSRLRRDKLIPLLAKRLYPYADAVVGASDGVAHDLVAKVGVAGAKVSVIYNPIYDDELLTRARETSDHPWLKAEKPAPVFLGVGRLSPEKDFPTLLKAFARVRAERPARLIILGEGAAQAELEAVISALGIERDVSLPGFVENPYAYMSRADALVLSSRREGFGNVLVEAMACGCPVVATDCPGGPKEILAAGQYGALVPIGDTIALAKAMQRALDAPVQKELLRQRAQYFSIERATAKYLKLLLPGKGAE